MSPLNSESKTQIHELIAHLANAPSSTRWMAKGEGELVAIGRLRAIFETIKGWFGFTNRTSDLAVKNEFIYLLAKGDSLGVFTAEKFQLITKVAASIGLIKGVITESASLRQVPINTRAALNALIKQTAIEILKPPVVNPIAAVPSQITFSGIKFEEREDQGITSNLAKTVTQIINVTTEDITANPNPAMLQPLPVVVNDNENSNDETKLELIQHKVSDDTSAIDQKSQELTMGPVESPFTRPLTRQRVQPLSQYSTKGIAAGGVVRRMLGLAGVLLFGLIGGLSGAPPFVGGPLVKTAQDPLQPAFFDNDTPAMFNHTCIVLPSMSEACNDDAIPNNTTAVVGEDALLRDAVRISPEDILPSSAWNSTAQVTQQGNTTTEDFSQEENEPAENEHEEPIPTAPGSNATLSKPEALSNQASASGNMSMLAGPAGGREAAIDFPSPLEPIASQTVNAHLNDSQINGSQTNERQDVPLKRHTLLADESAGKWGLAGRTRQLVGVAMSISALALSIFSCGISRPKRDQNADVAPLPPRGDIPPDMAEVDDNGQEVAVPEPGFKPGPDLLQPAGLAMADDEGGSAASTDDIPGNQKKPVIPLMEAADEFTSQTQDVNVYKDTITANPTGKESAESAADAGALFRQEDQRLADESVDDVLATDTTAADIQTETSSPLAVKTHSEEVVADLGEAVQGAAAGAVDEEGKKEDLSKTVSWQIRDVSGEQKPTETPVEVEAAGLASQGTAYKGVLSTLMDFTARQQERTRGNEVLDVAPAEEVEAKKLSPEEITKTLAEVIPGFRNRHIIYLPVTSLLGMPRPIGPKSGDAQLAQARRLQQAFDSQSRQFQHAQERIQATRIARNDSRTLSSSNTLPFLNGRFGVVSTTANKPYVPPTSSFTTSKIAMAALNIFRKIPK